MYFGAVRGLALLKSTENALFEILTKRPSHNPRAFNDLHLALWMVWKQLFP
jgi:hypothetical protein